MAHLRHARKSVEIHTSCTHVGCLIPSRIHSVGGYLTPLHRLFADICAIQLPSSFAAFGEATCPKWKTQQRDITTHCRRELMHAIWKEILDETSFSKRTSMASSCAALTALSGAYIPVFSPTPPTIQKSESVLMIRKYVLIEWVQSSARYHQGWRSLPLPPLSRPKDEARPTWASAGYGYTSEECAPIPRRPRRMGS